jgi:hypothetical protein
LLLRADVGYERLAESFDLACGDLQRVTVVAAAAEDVVVGE